jgi:hypothetical protein
MPGQKLGQKMFDWGAMKKEQMKIRIFQVFGHFDGIKKTKNFIKKLNLYIRVTVRDGP